MVFSYNWLQSFFDKKLPKPEKLAELLTMKFFEVCEVKKAGNDFILDIDVLPNRAGDCFSHLGIARECAAILSLKMKMPALVKTFKGKKTNIAIEVKQKLACPRYTAGMVTGVKVGSSPKWLKERLKVCGLKSINNIVDAVNYVMLETGQPLHAFDAEKLSGHKIIVRFAKKGEKITTLDGQRFNLDPKILVIADAKNPIAIAGIKGGKGPAVGKGTKTIVLESANFDSHIVRRGSMNLGLKTDASLRFEHGLDPNLTEFAVRRASFLIQKTGGGKSAEKLADIYPKKVYPKIVKLDCTYLSRLLGVKIERREVKAILVRLGFKILKENFPNLIIEIPTRRIDVSLPEDLIEEIGRIYGYEKIPAAFPMAALVPPHRNEEIFWENMVKDILKGAGFTEVYNYSFVSEKGGVEVQNPMSFKYKYLRASLAPGLMKNIRENINNFQDIKIFELGKTFTAKSENRLLAAAINPPNFYYLKGVVDSLLHKLGLSDFWYEDFGKKSAVIKADSKDLGRLTENFFELDFEILQKFCSEEHEYQPLSKFPALVRDLAVLVPLQTKVEEVLNAINAAGGPLVRDIDVFDIYEGEELPQGKKNLAFHIIYQSDKKTLTSDEVEKIHRKIIKTLENNSLWQVRK